jgi:hypothetical protein
VAHHAAAIIGNLDELLASGLDLNLDACGTGVEGVLQQLLHYGRWALNDLAGGDLVSDVLGEDVNTAHGVWVKFGR